VRSSRAVEPALKACADFHQIENVDVQLPGNATGAVGQGGKAAQVASGKTGSGETAPPASSATSVQA
jgi:hypothetical protein